jgi:hypothetical protein
MLHTFVIRPTQERKVWSLVHLREVIKYGCTSEFVRSRVTLLQCQQPPTQLFVYLKLFRSSPTQFYDLSIITSSVICGKNRNKMSLVKSPMKFRIHPEKHVYLPRSSPAHFHGLTSTMPTSRMWECATMQPST